MARYYVKMPDFDPNVSSLGGISETNYDTRAIAFRDAIRDVLDPDDLATNWLVSDIAKWQGLSAQADGYAFTIFHRSGGSNTGPAWTWVLPGEYFSNEAEPEEIMQSAQMSNYFYDSGGTTNFGFDGCPSVHYCPVGGTSDPYDFGYNLADGTLASGDFTAPSTNPYSDLATFMPSTPLRGIVYDGLSDSAIKARHLIVADDSKPFLAIYFTAGLSLTPNYCTVMGDIIVPYRSTDTETHGVLSFEHNFTTSIQGGVSDDILQVVRDTGALLEVDDFYNDIFTEFNVPFADGTYPWDVIALQSNDYFKGWVDSDVLRVMGPKNLDLYSLYDGGLFIKYNEAYCFPYVANQVVWPTSPGS